MVVERVAVQHDERVRIQVRDRAPDGVAGAALFGLVDDGDRHVGGVVVEVGLDGLGFVPDDEDDPGRAGGRRRVDGVSDQRASRDG